MAYLYRHVRLDKNEVFYIRIGEDDGKKYSRAYSKKQRNRHWNFIVSITQYEIEIVLDNLTWEEACQKEKEFIKLYGRRDLCEGTLVNMTDGGDGVIGHTHSNETRRKIASNNPMKREDVVDKWKTSMQNRTLSEKMNTSDTMKGVKKDISQCKYCVMKAAKCMITRYHNDNCKHK